MVCAVYYNNGVAFAICGREIGRREGMKCEEKRYVIIHSKRNDMRSDGRTDNVGGWRETFVFSQIFESRLSVTHANVKYRH